MKVLILSQYYTPEPLPKAHELAKGLTERGHQVTVVTGFPNYPDGTIYKRYRIQAWRVENIDGVRVIRVPLYPDHSRSTLRRILNYLSFSISASVLGPVLCGMADVMFVFHPPLTIGIAAWVISLIRRLPFVYWVGDLWPEMPVASGMLRSRKLVAMLECLADFVYARAHLIAVASPGMIEHLKAKGVPEQKLRVLTDWADESIFHPLPTNPGLAEELGMKGKFNILFAGYLGIAQKLDTLLEAAETLRPYGNIQLVIVGDGIEKARLEREIAQRKLGNIKLLGHYPMSTIADVYALADVLLVHLSAHPIFDVSIPAKTYGYMACSKPILAAVNGATAKLIPSARAGLTCPPENPGAMAETVLMFSYMSKEEREEMGRNGRAVFLRHYSRAIGLKEHEELLLECATKPRS